MEARAIGKGIPGSPQKSRLVIDLIRGQSVNTARSTLLFARKRAARPILNVLNSAIANAERKAEDANVSIDIDELFVLECKVDSGPTKHRAGVRRYRPAPRGRAFMERRRSSRVTITVSTPIEKVEKAGA
ncbi:MAG: 50S ribosomal protein L22 [Acidobacteria bacterium]|nr:50S ribosomal protein L22 [Acidobacteriota bacterium]